MDANGHLHTSTAGICEAFGSFYANLYTGEEGEDASMLEELPQGSSTPVTIPEVEEALKTMKNNKTAAEDGLVAEMLKAGGNPLMDTIAGIFTELLFNHMELPESWRKSRLTVLFKTGDRQLPKNYRPITIVLVLSKLYSTVILRRIQEILESTQIDTQFGNRKGRGCSDAVHILRQVVEKSIEWGETLWAAALDVEKAFDRAHHLQILKALIEENVDADIVMGLRRMYTRLQGYVQMWPGACSGDFGIGRGVRQGDPLSPILFGLVMKRVLKGLDAKWQSEGFGTNIGKDLVTGRRLTHIAFVDDVTLITRNWLSLKSMIKDLKERLAGWGLSLHPTKCKAQTTNADWTSRGLVQVCSGLAVEVLPKDACLTVLGTQVALETGSTKEVRSRISKGWKTFFGMKVLLCRRSISLKRRLALYEATVTSGVLWCSESWALREADKQLLKTAQNQMLRKIVGIRRREDQSLVDWVITSTRSAWKIAEASGVRCWLTAHADSKWRWAGHVARMKSTELVWKVTAWRDEQWQELQQGHRPLRSRPGRWTRWEDPVRIYASRDSAGHWKAQANDREGWKKRAGPFIEMFCA